MRHAKHKPICSIAVVTTVVVAFALGNGSCSGCEERDDETLIRSMVRHAVGLAEQHKLGDLMKLTTKELTVRPRGSTRQKVKGMLLIAFRRYGEFSIKHPRPAVTIDPSKIEARVELPFVIVRQGRTVPELGELYDDPERWLEELGEIADLYHLELWLIKDGDDWLVDQAEIQGFRSLESI